MLATATVLEQHISASPAAPGSPEPDFDLSDALGQQQGAWAESVHAHLLQLAPEVCAALPGGGTLLTARVTRALVPALADSPLSPATIAHLTHAGRLGQVEGFPGADYLRLMQAVLMGARDVVAERWTPEVAQECTQLLLAVREYLVGPVEVSAAPARGPVERRPVTPAPAAPVAPAPAGAVLDLRGRVLAQLEPEPEAPPAPVPPRLPMPPRDLPQDPSQLERLLGFPLYPDRHRG